jgi:carbonic anhydrase/acetyltransferase-like protein (isoleucine patch superfamily)
MTLLSLSGKDPRVHPDTWIAPDAVLVGEVVIEAGTSVFYISVLRADGDTITIGAGSNVQDGCVVHADPGLPVRVGRDVSVGHRAVLHGCTIEDGVLVGMGAVVMNGAVVGSGSILAAGTVILEGTVVPPNSLVAGVPGKVRRETNEEEHAGIRRNAAVYRDLARRHAEAEPLS